MWVYVLNNDVHKGKHETNFLQFQESFNLLWVLRITESSSGCFDCSVEFPTFWNSSSKYPHNSLKWLTIITMCGNDSNQIILLEGRPPIGGNGNACFLKKKQATGEVDKYPPLVLATVPSRHDLRSNKIAGLKTFVRLVILPWLILIGYKGQTPKKAGFFHLSHKEYPLMDHSQKSLLKKHQIVCKY